LHAATLTPCDFCNNRLRLKALGDHLRLQLIRPSSWINQVDRFFANLTEHQIRRGVHRSTRRLEKAVRDYINAINDDPKPIRWTKSADGILGSIKRFCLTLRKSPIPKPNSSKLRNRNTRDLSLELVK
jgi:hypothetical protein